MEILQKSNNKLRSTFKSRMNTIEELPEDFYIIPESDRMKTDITPISVNIEVDKVKKLKQTILSLKFQMDVILLQNDASIIEYVSKRVDFDRILSEINECKELIITHTN